MRNRFDVVIIGSGPAGVAVAERLYEMNATATIAIIERGPFLLSSHFYDSGGSIHDRDHFMARHRFCPWDGDLSQGGALLPALGGRGIVGGSQLHRFYANDFTLWKQGQWRIGCDDLDPYFSEAEKRLFGSTRCVGYSQDYACAALDRFDAQHPPCGPDPGGIDGLDFGVAHRSSARRIAALVEVDSLSAQPRLSVFSELIAARLVPSFRQKQRILYARCVPSNRLDANEIDIAGDVFVLAASPIESARLVLASELEDTTSRSSAVGRYLAEHIYCRGYLDSSDSSDLNQGPINIFIPPPSLGLDDRYQIEIRSMTHADPSQKVVRITGSAAMDPSPENRVSIIPDRMDSYGIPRAFTFLRPTEADRRRVSSMFAMLTEVASSLGAKWLYPPVSLPCGASYHESGTLRISSSEQESAAAEDGRLFGTSNVFVGDGAAFASVGVANPILTLTAMGYRLGDRLAGIT
ncbi:GMC oxidoreductase [Actinophytocola glycyrrhizae]|uniref:GMC oxidoreductase n=1 Tax=Actinophytocola glycyrrhizae TaxID=2044873 RepID=A0ABV9RYI8_9PSEU